MAEKSVVMPMFETMIWELVGRHDLVNDLLHLFHIILVADRVPEGAFSLTRIDQDHFLGKKGDPEKGIERKRKQCDADEAEDRVDRFQQRSASCTVDFRAFSQVALNFLTIQTCGEVE